MPQISVIVPVYKAEKYINRCVNSILGQSYSDFEVILVDDGSPDRSGMICDEYAAKDDRVHVIHQKNAGCSAARNAGIEWALRCSDSKWVVFLDSDDWFHRENLAVLLEMAERHNAQIAMCACCWTSEEPADVDVGTVNSEAMEPEHALTHHHEKCTPPWGKLIWKPLLKELRFPEGMRYEDAYITHVLILSANRVAVCTQKLIYYYNNPDSFTRVGWSEERLVAISVHEHRMAYFQEHGYDKAYRKEQELYMEVLTDNLQCLMNLLDQGEMYQNYFQMLLQKHRSVFHKARKQKVTNLRWETIWFYIFGTPGDLLWQTARLAQKVYHKLKR